jgi:hypothetical protein
MASQWFVRNNNEVVGPLTTAQLVELARQGKVLENSRVRRGTEKKWYKAGNVVGLFPAAEPSEQPPAHVPATFLTSLSASWRNGRGHWIWVALLALVALPMLSLLKPVLGIQGLVAVMAGLAGLTLLLRFVFFLRHVWFFYVRAQKEARTKSSLTARLGRATLLMVPIVGLLAIAEYFSTPRGLVADFVSPAAQQQERLLAWLGVPLETGRIEAESSQIAKSEEGNQQTSDSRQGNPDDVVDIADAGQSATSSEPGKDQSRRSRKDGQSPPFNRPSAEAATSEHQPSEAAEKNPGEATVAGEAGQRSVPAPSAEQAKHRRGGGEPGESQLSVGEATWALLIGVKGYKSVPPLKSTANDVEKIGESLIRVGNVPDTQIVRVTDDRPTKPDYSALMATIEEVLTNPRIGPDKHLIIYYSGHGLLDAEEAMYLAPRDVDVKNIKATAIPTSWLRERLRECQAGVKLLVLDACHSGASKSTLAFVDGGKLAGEFKYGPGVITISGCKGEQFSWESPKLNQGVFTYYLVEAIRGAGDRDQNARIDIDELYRYVSERVPQHALEEFQAPQNPVRWIGPDVVGVPEIVQLPQQVRGPRQEVPESPHVTAQRPLSDGGVVRTVLSEDFDLVRVGQLPDDWVGDVGIGVRTAAENQAWLQPSSKGWHHVRSKPFDLSGDFQLELNTFLPQLGEIRITLEGIGTTDLKCGIRRHYGPQGQSYLADAEEARVEGLGEQGNRLTVEREGDVYILKLDDQVVMVHRIDNSGRFQRLWLETYQPETRIDNLTIQLAIADRKQVFAGPPKELFFQDFAKVRRGTLPAGWDGPGALGVFLDGSIGWLRASKDGPATAVVELPTIRGDFEVSSLFTLPPLGTLQIGLVSGNQRVAAAIRRHYGPQGTASLADAKPLQFEGLSECVSRLALRRESNVYSLILDGRELLVHRIPGMKLPTKLEVSIDSSETRVLNIGIWQLPAVAQPQN